MNKRIFNVISARHRPSGFFDGFTENSLKSPHEFLDEIYNFVEFWINPNKILRKLDL
jgi:hypothetical protein